MSPIEKLVSAYGSEWREHHEYSGYYFSQDGRCARVGKRHPRLLIGCTCGLGYRAISCAIGGGKYKRIYIHRAVCELFNGDPNGFPHCRHLDGDMSNNAANNLAWGTPLDNMEDMRRHGRTTVGIRNPQAKLCPSLVEKMRQAYGVGGVSHKKVAAQFGVSTMTAFRAITGRSWK